MANLRLRLSKLTVDTGKLTQPGSPVYDAVERAGKAAVNAVKDATPVRTGNLRDAWEYKITTTPTRVIANIQVAGPDGPGTPRQYVRFVVFGTQGPITAQPSSKSLKIIDGRGPMWHGSVSGQAPNKFAQKALKSIRRQDFEP